MYARDGIELCRSTMCTWHMQLATLVEPLVAAMRTDAFAQPFLCTDATGVLVQSLKKCRRAHFWVLVAPGRHVLFEYTRDHSGDVMDSVLAGYEGYLVADAHVVYDHMYEGGHVVEVNCWARVRKYFFKALESESESARTALDLIGALFKIERAIKTAPRKKRERIRKKHAAPIVERFFSWCDEQWPSLMEDTPIYAGVRYARNQRKGLERFLSDGRLPLDNNVSERELRRQAVGRKNWMFVGSDDGARANTVFVSLLASCRMLDVEPWAYLRDILCLVRDGGSFGCNVRWATAYLEKCRKITRMMRMTLTVLIAAMALASFGCEKGETSQEPAVDKTEASSIKTMTEAHLAGLIAKDKN